MYQYVKSLDIDCDKDTSVSKVEQIGAAWHTGNRTCFFTRIAENERYILLTSPENRYLLFGIIHVNKEK